MYIEDYWGEYIGGSDDSLTLTYYLAGKEKQLLPLSEIFADFGAKTLFEAPRTTTPPLGYTGPDGGMMALDYVIDLAGDLAALLLECREGGSFDLAELDDTLELEEGAGRMSILPTPAEYEQLGRILADFAAAPEEYDIAEMLSPDELAEMAGVFGRLHGELFGQAKA